MNATIGFVVLLMPIENKPRMSHTHIVVGCRQQVMGGQTGNDGEDHSFAGGVHGWVRE